MRYLLGFMCVLALGVMGCGETSGDGGTGGVVTDCSGVENGSECIIGDFAGQCSEGVCLVLDCSDVDDGADCIGGGGDFTFFGLCVAGSCDKLERCENDEVCRAYGDCSADTCLSNGLCQESGAVEDGTPCAGGACEGGECVLEGSRLPCTEQGIRNAIAAGGGPYVFDCNAPTTVVTKAEIVIDNDVILDGEGAVTLDAQQSHRVYSVETDTTVELRGFTISRGNAARGGGILNEGVLTLTNSTVSENEASDGDGGGILNEGMLALANSAVSGNATNHGGAGIFNAATMTLTNSTVSGNKGGEIYVNHEDGYGGGIANSGTMTLTNSTVSNNEAFYGAGIFNDGPAALANCTVSANETRFLGAPVIYANGGMLTLTNSLIDDDCYGSVISNGHNIESQLDTCRFDQPTDQVNVTVDDLKLGPLQDNGGPTETHALGAGSVAIDLIPAIDCEVDEDQRGEPRPGGTMCDVGAFEVQP